MLVSLQSVIVEESSILLNFWGSGEGESFTNSKLSTVKALLELD